MLDINKEKIIEVYVSQKDASNARKFSNGAAICKAIAQGTLSSGHYWMKYANLFFYTLLIGNKYGKL